MKIKHLAKYYTLDVEVIASYNATVMGNATGLLVRGDKHCLAQKTKIDSR